jgi:hypothetical protein
MIRSPLHDVLLRSLTGLMVVAVIGACTLNTDVSAPGALLKYGGDAQTAPANTVLPTDMTVLVVNQFGERLKNVTVNWSIAAGGGTLSSNSTPTDDSGLAAVTYTTGPTAGTAVVRVQVHGPPPITFTATIT